MKQFKLTCLLIVLISMAEVKALAYNACIDGIYYNFSGTNAEVTYYSLNSDSNKDAYKGSVVIPESVTYNNKTYSVTSIGNVAFGDCTELTSVIIGNGVKSIGYRAFYSCSGLTSVTIPNSVTSIDRQAFSLCSGLISVSIGSGVTSIGKEVFVNCTGLSSVTIGNNVTSIGDYAFGWCSGLTSVTIPNSVTSIGSGTFQSCSKLTSVTIPSSVTSIGDDAFASCTSLTSVTIPNSVTSIGDQAFGWCSGLTSITIPNSVTSIGKATFYGCSKLSSVTIPICVTKIGDGAFAGCSGLTSIIVNTGNIKYDSRNNCNGIIETASSTLILGCKNTTIPNSVTSIGDYAFYGCIDLISIVIPNSVTRIGGYAFNGCSSLTSVTAINPTPVAITQNVFTNRTNATLYVPIGSKTAYEVADYWKEFKEIVEIDPSGIEEISIQGNGFGNINQEGATWYTIDGKRASEPQRGLNIIRMNDGTTRKVVIK